MGVTSRWLTCRVSRLSWNKQWTYLGASLLSKVKFASSPHGASSFTVGQDKTFSLPPDRPNKLGPLHTRAKSRDHEIVRAQKKLSKGRSNTPPTSYSAVIDPKVQCEAICDRAFNQMLFQWISIHVGPHTWYYRLNQRLWAFRVPWFLGFARIRPTFKRWFLRIVQVTVKHDPFDAMWESM
jgi:hypothetical protein